MAQTGTSILDLSDQAQDAAQEKAEAAQSNVTGTASSLKGLDFNFNIKVGPLEALIRGQKGAAGRGQGLGLWSNPHGAWVALCLGMVCDVAVREDGWAGCGHPQCL